MQTEKQGDTVVTLPASRASSAPSSDLTAAAAGDSNSLRERVAGLGIAIESNRLTDEASHAGAAARVANAAVVSAAAAVPGESLATTPDFTRIYAFFAALFDPMNPPIAEKLIHESDLSALDWEIIKLLVRNLEVNVDSVVFRQQLAETYRQQEVRQQQLGQQEQQEQQ